MNQRNFAGFTLVETLMVIAIMCAVIVSTPFMLQWLRQQGVRHAAAQLQADLQLARVMAIRQKQTCKLRFNTPGINQYINTLNGRRTDLRSYRGGVQFLNRGPDGKKMASEVNFDRQGMSGSVLPADIFLSDGQGLATYRIRILLPGGISVYCWSANQWH